LRALPRQECFEVLFFSLPRRVGRAAAGARGGTWASSPQAEGRGPEGSSLGRFLVVPTTSTIGWPLDLRRYGCNTVAPQVTGKLDVREAAAGLPDEPEELEDASMLLEGEDEADQGLALAADEVEVGD